MKKEHEILFTPYRLGEVELKNRYVMVAMGTGGMVTQENTFNQRGIEYYVERAKGGAGLIITGTLYVENEIEKVTDGVMPCPTDHPGAFMMSAAELCERVHAYDTKIFAQLTAGFGRVIKPNLLLVQPVSASEVPHFWDPDLTCRELTVKEIQTIIRKTGEAAKICQQAGFDGVEIHAVHEGYLLDQFSLTLFNHRTDEYGGDLRGRLKFACDIVRSIKTQCGENFPVLLRYSMKSYIKAPWQGGLPGETFMELGRDIPEGLEAARILQEAGYDGLDVDAGAYDSWYWAHPPMYFEKGMNRSFGKLVRECVEIPVLVAGRMEDPDMAAESLRKGEMDLVGLGRSLLADPQIINHIAGEKFEQIRPCLGCHEGCMQRLVSARPVSCAVNPACGREKEYGLSAAEGKKRVTVVGGGVAGMEAARVLKIRGHQVVLLEDGDALGGALLLAGIPDFKREDLRLAEWYRTELRRLKIPVMLNTRADVKKLRELEAEQVIIATGGTAKELTLPGGAQLLMAEHVLRGEKEPGQNVIMIGGGLVGCELALHLAKQGKKVTILKRSKDLLTGRHAIPAMNREMLLDLLEMYHVTIHVGVQVLRAEEDGCQKKVTFRVDGEEISLTAESVVCAAGYRANDELYEACMKENMNVYKIGDARRPRNIMNAIWDAYEVARSI